MVDFADLVPGSGVDFSDLTPAPLDRSSLNAKQKRELRKAYDRIRGGLSTRERESERLGKLGVDAGFLDTEEGARKEFGRKTKATMQGSGRGAFQGATFEMGDEAVAGVRSLISGRPYSDEYADEQKRIAQAKKDAGNLYTAANIAGSFTAPGAVAARGMNYAMRAPTIAGQIARGAGVGAATGAATAYGAQEDKNAARAAVVGGGMGGAFGAATPAIAAGARTIAPYIDDYAARWDAYFSPGNQIRRFPGQEYDPEANVMRAAARSIGKDLQNAGMVERQNFRAAERAASIPGQQTPFVVAAPDTIKNKFVDNTTTFSTLPGSNRYARLVRDMTRPGGVSQGQRVASDFKKAAGVTSRPETVYGRRADALEISDQELNALRAKGGKTTVPGLGKEMRESRDYAEKIYNDAVKTNAVRGPGQVDPDAVPLFGDRYRRAVAKWKSRQAAAKKAGQNFTEPRPELLSDRNIPVSVLMSMRNRASQDAAKGDEAALRLHAMLDNALKRASAKSRAGTLRDNIAGRRVTHETGEAFDQGTTVMQPDNVLAQARRTSELARATPAQRTAHREGAVHGVAEQLRARVDAGADAARAGISRTPGEVEAYNNFVLSGGSAPGWSPAQLNRRVGNIEDRQRLAQSVANALKGRKPTGDDASALTAALDAARRFQFSAGYGTVTSAGYLSRFYPEGLRHAENQLLMRGADDVFDAVQAARNYDAAWTPYINNRSTQSYVLADIIRRQLLAEEERRATEMPK